MIRILTLLFVFFSFSVVAQELNCRVVVNADQIQTTERTIFTEMETAFTQFMNQRTWTEDEYGVDERINCNIIITLDPNESIPQSGNWGASVQILSSRPVYNSGYETILLNFADRDWNFEYQASYPLQFNENSFTNNITSLLAYYAYVIIGLDYDSFEELGGTRQFQVSSQIVSNAQNENYKGWSQFNSIRNRYWLSENLLGSNFEPLRKALYQYHIKGLDIFQEDPETARVNILEALKAVRVANKSRPRSIFTMSFIDAKADELTQIFKEGTPAQKREAFEILSEIDPSKMETFNRIND
mgnify:CR=1 FL=1